MHWSMALDHLTVEPPRTSKGTHSVGSKTSTNSYIKMLGSKNLKVIQVARYGKILDLFQSFLEVYTLQNKELIPEKRRMRRPPSLF